MADTYEIIHSGTPDCDMILDVANGDLFYRAAFTAYHYSAFIIEQGEPNPWKEHLTAAMLGLLFNTTDYVRIILDNNELVGYCLDAGFRPIFRIVSQ
jgi:hypothetical protein